jgi:predicted membrane protein
VERKVSTDDFQGGQISTTFGGVDIDLRQAGMRGDSAVLDINCIFGGVEIKIPRNWIAVSQVAAIFGGIGNSSAQPASDMPGVKRLYLKGSVVFGGVEVKN